MNFITNHPRGAFVRIAYGTRTVRRFFAYLKHGGKRAAQAAAQEFIEEALRNRPRGPYRMKTGPQKNSRSRVRGVCRIVIKRRNGKRYPHYTSLHKYDGKWKVKQFWPGPHGGLDNAFKAAVMFRRKFEESLEV